MIHIFCSVIVEALKVDSLQKLCSSLEPILRRVVRQLAWHYFLTIFCYILFFLTCLSFWFGELGLCILQSYFLFTPTGSHFYTLHQFLKLCLLICYLRMLEYLKCYHDIGFKNSFLSLNNVDLGFLGKFMISPRFFDLLTLFLLLLVWCSIKDFVL